MHRIKVLVSYILNAVIPKKKNSIYARCMENSYLDKYDIINCNSSNMLRTLSSFINTYHNQKVYIYLEYCDDNRKEVYTNVVNNARSNNIELKMLRHYVDEKDLLKRIKRRFCNACRRFSCKLWLTESGFNRLDGKLPCQTAICLNYYIPYKNDYIPGLKQNWAHLDNLITTALLPTYIASSIEKVEFGKCSILGFPRNDTFKNGTKSKEVMQWIEHKCGYVPKYVIVYAPTFREYEHNESEERNIMGYPCPLLESELIENRAVLICKLHPLQNAKIIRNEKCVIQYEESYDFSFYDLLAISSCLIGDYSSVNLDYLLLDKPIIYNLYDFEKYSIERGISYDPQLLYCSGSVVHNEDELVSALRHVFAYEDLYSEQRHKLLGIIHKYDDAESTRRAVAFLNQNLK